MLAGKVIPDWECTLAREAVTTKTSVLNEIEILIVKFAPAKTVATAKKKRPIVEHMVQVKDTISPPSHLL
ncbi:hypothetical protein DSUL_140049 [Desulfovibrionales bacterium]